MFNEYVDWTFCLFPPSFRGKVFSLWASLIVTAVADLPALQERQVDPWFGKIPWRRKWQPPLVFLPGESHGQRSLGGCSPGVAKIGHTECLPRPHFLVLLPSWRSSILFLFLWKILFPTNGWRVLSNTIFFFTSIELNYVVFFFSFLMWWIILVSFIILV